MDNVKVVETNVLQSDLSDAQMKERTDCFGISFDVTDDLCRNRCDFTSRCIQRIARVEVPSRLRQVGVPSFNRAELAAELAVTMETAHVIEEVGKGMHFKSAIALAYPQGAAEAVVPLIKLPDPSAPSEEGDEETEQVAESPAPKAKTAPVLKVVAHPGVSEPEVKKKSAPPKGPRKASSKPQVAAKKITPPKPAPAIVPAPKAPAEVPKAPAPKKAAKAPAAKAKKPRKLSPRDPVEAFHAERRRSKFVATLALGQKLEREWKGDQVSVKVLSEGYRLSIKGGDTLTFPTLYSATAHVAGMKAHGDSPKTATWSAERFWSSKPKSKGVP